MRMAWVDNEGRIHEKGNHLAIAFRLFPKSANPELSCEKAGYVKTGYMLSGSPVMENYNPDTATQAQINAVAKLWEEHYAGPPNVTKPRTISITTEEKQQEAQDESL